MDRFFDRTNLLVAAPYTALDTVITLDYAENISDYYNGGSPYVPFSLVWWDAAAVPNPADDPLFEIVTVTNITNPGGTTYELTVTRGQQGTTASAKPANSHLMQTGTAENFNSQIAPKTGENFQFQGSNPAPNVFKLYNETTGLWQKIALVGDTGNEQIIIYAP